MDFFPFRDCFARSTRTISAEGCTHKGDIGIWQQFRAIRRPLVTATRSLSCTAVSRHLIRTISAEGRARANKICVSLHFPRRLVKATHTLRLNAVSRHWYARSAQMGVTGKLIFASHPVSHARRAWSSQKPGPGHLAAVGTKNENSINGVGKCLFIQFFTPVS